MQGYEVVQEAALEAAVPGTGVPGTVVVQGTAQEAALGNLTEGIPGIAPEAVLGIVSEAVRVVLLKIFKMDKVSQSTYLLPAWSWM